MTRYLGCLGLLKPEVDLIRTILRTSSRLDGGWQLVERGECDALLVYNIDKDVSPFISKSSTQFIMIKRRGEPFNGHVCYKPFRADELIDTLIDIQSSGHPTFTPAQAPTSSVQPESTPTQTSQSQANVYRLIKWPPAELLSRHKNYMLLAVYLSRGAKSLQDLVTLSGQAEAMCTHFLMLLQEHKLLQIDDGARLQSTRSQPASASRAHEKQGFFSMLKARLGLDNK